MKSIAIWFTPQETSSSVPQDVELHFNFWKIPNGAKDSSKFLDIGLKLCDTRGVKSLNIYFPAKVDSPEFQDIVSKFISKPDLVSAIFNENYKVTSDPTSKAYNLTDSGNNFVFAIYKTSVNDIHYESIFDGTIISIHVPKREEKTYYRFRVTGAFIQSLSTISKPTNAVLESAFSEIEMIDFRVNEIRDLHQDLLERIRSESLPKIRKQHFFFICSNEEEVVGNHQPYISCRNLENYRWGEYVDIAKINQKVFLAYHWKEDNKDSVANLIKTKYERNNWKTIAKYLVIGLLVAIAIELFSNWLYDLLKGSIIFKSN